MEATLTDISTQQTPPNSVRPNMTPPYSGHLFTTDKEFGVSCWMEHRYVLYTEVVHCTVHIGSLTKILFARIPRIRRDSHPFSRNIVIVSYKFCFSKMVMCVGIKGNWERRHAFSCFLNK